MSDFGNYFTISKLCSKSLVCYLLWTTRILLQLSIFLSERLTSQQKSWQCLFHKFYKSKNFTLNDVSPDILFSSKVFYNKLTGIHCCKLELTKETETSYIWRQHIAIQKPKSVTGPWRPGWHPFSSWFSHKCNVWRVYYCSSV